jgi:enoyl-CoA hydratase/carnithine racemase
MPDLLVDSADGVVSITLARAAKKNAITNAMYGEFAEALSRAASDPAIRVALIKADGPDFCAGNDINMFAETVATGGDISKSNARPFLAALSTFPKPLVAAVVGKAIGVGVTMLLHCDLVYVAEDAALRMPFVDLGLVPEAGAARLLPARIGHARAFALFAFGETLSGADAARLGLANAALPAGEVINAAMRAATTLAQKSPAALAATKALMRDADAIREALAADSAAFTRLLASPEAMAAFAAFAARKNPA